MKKHVEGHVDGLKGRRLRGWAWRPDRPSRPVTVEVWQGKTLLARVLADQFRSDLKDAGKGDGACAFAIPLEGVEGEVVVRTARRDGEVELIGGRLTLEPCAQPPGWSAAVTAEGWLGGLDRFGPTHVSGWVRSRERPSLKPELELWADGAPALRFAAAGWRKDLAELGQGDGRWGFDVLLPPRLRDGVARRYDLRLAEEGASLLSQDLLVTLPASGEIGAAPAPPARAAAEPAPARRQPQGPPELSIVVNFYNMRREAERTLASLSRSYQRGIDDLAYEVLCVDNGSNPPLDRAFVESFGPEFRLVRPKSPNPSPCAPLNAAAAEARGRYIAMMIDGAHVVTPGALAEALRHLRADTPQIVGLRQWFIGGDQRFLSQVGYTQEQEDILFASIGWPADGYLLYQIGAPMDESPGTWTAGLSESNCLFMPAATWREIGGYDEGFVTPGGGLANLDLFKRAVAAAHGAVTCLIGEASFHQYHGGTTTNVHGDEKDARVEAYQLEYIALRGERYEGLSAEYVRLAGRIHTKAACLTRQRPMFPAPLGVTDRVRPASRRLTLDEGACTFLAGSFVELDLHNQTRWAGEPVGVGPADLVHIQELIWSIRPTAIVTTARRAPLLRLIDAMCNLAGLGGTPILVPSEQPLDGAPARACHVHGSPWAPQTLDAIERHIADAEEVLVLFEPPDAPGVPFDALRRYAELVTYGSYIVYLNSALGQPWLGYSTRWPMKAIRMLTEHGERYAVDPRFDETLGSTCPKGFIRRVGGLIKVYEDDPALDDLDAI
jgi:cephalosporin hydroxylase